LLGALQAKRATESAKRDTESKPPSNGFGFVKKKEKANTGSPARRGFKFEDNI
jgi:hypothetical protein